MILYENAAEAVVRVGEEDLAGRRVAARAIPYAGEVGLPRWRFDPIDRRFVERGAAGSVAVGPYDPEAWRAVLGKSPAGTIAVGPCDPSEQVRGAYRAAAEGAAQAGRGVYLLDPSPEALPGAAADAFVLVFSWFPGGEPGVDMREARRRGFAAGCVLPLVAGWTAEQDEVERAVAAAAEAGALFVAAALPADDGIGRRAIIEARRELDPGGPEDFFERVHHGDWSASSNRGRLHLNEACARWGLALLPPRPVGRSELLVNAVAASRLEEKAQAVWGRDEHHASLLHAAARWIDESGRDLGSILNEGNFRKIFPFGEELAGEAEEAIREAHA